jgi:hypothetical protein
MVKQRLGHAHSAANWKTSHVDRKKATGTVDGYEDGDKV